MIELRLYNSTHYDDLNYTLDEAQSKFTFSIDYCVHQRKDLEDPSKQIISILNSNTAVGFFVLDIGKDKLKLKNNDKAILLRSLSVHPNTQGQGIGKKAMHLLADYVLENYRDMDEIILSVHKYNLQAIKLYISVGFIDTGLEVLSPEGEDLSVFSLNLIHE